MPNSLPVRTVPASEYDALAEMFRAVCEANGYDASDIRYFMADYADAEIAFAQRVLAGETSHDLFTCTLESVGSHRLPLLKTEVR